MPVSIRTAGLNDINSIQRIAALTWPNAYANILSAAQVSYMLHTMYNTAILQQQMNDGHIFLIAEADENVIGFAGFSPLNKTNWKLHKLYVLPYGQQKGVGKMLLQQVENKIIQQAGTTLLLNVNRSNSAVQFYKKTGFQIVDEGDFSIGNGFYMNDYVMQKQLV